MDRAPTRWRITLEYHGRDFVGWQVQPEGRSIQATLEEALARFAGHPVRVTGSGRTDSGVHALGQVASFDLHVERTPSAVRDGLNHHLPPDIACVDAQAAPPGFDARRWVLRKRYRYQWLDRRARSPLAADRAWHVRSPLDVDRMAVAARALIGRHDFTSFRAAGCGATHAVRVVEAITVGRADDLVSLEMIGNGFLRHMVRNVAGSLYEIGRGARPAEWLDELLAARDRQRSGATAPAHGLTLVEVSYGAGPRPWAAEEDDE